MTTKCSIDTEYIKSSLKLLSQNEPVSRFADTVDNKLHGRKVVNKEKFTSIYKKYVLIWCIYYLSELVPNIIGSIRFDSSFYYTGK